MQTGFWRHGLATICKFREERPQRSELSAGSSDRGFGPSGQFRWAKRAGPALFLHGRGSNLAGGDLLGTRFLHSSRSIPTKTIESIRPCQISAARSAHDRNGSPFAIPFDVTRFQRSSPLAQTGINGAGGFSHARMKKGRPVARPRCRQAPASRGGTRDEVRVLNAPSRADCGSRPG